MVIVQITTPNNDNGDHILRLGGYLTPEVNLFPATNGQASIFDAARQILSFVNNEIRRIYNYETLILAVANSGQAEVLRLSECRNGHPIASVPNSAMKTPKLQGINKILDLLFNRFTNIVSDTATTTRCSNVRLNDSLRSDGSALRVLPSRNQLNEYGIEARDSYLRDGDEFAIAKLILDLKAAIDKSGRRVVFLIPPIFESPRPSLVNKIFSAALKISTGAEVIDHRFLRLDASHFTTFDHPNQKYYQRLVQELKQRKLLQ